MSRKKGAKGQLREIQLRQEDSMTLGMLLAYSVTETTLGEKAHATLGSTFRPLLNSVGKETGRATNRTTTTTTPAAAVVRDCERDRSHVISQN